jgi:hypothetical protein
MLPTRNSTEACRGRTSPWATAALVYCLRDCYTCAMRDTKTTSNRVRQCDKGSRLRIALPDEQVVRKASERT